MPTFPSGTDIKTDHGRAEIFASGSIWGVHIDEEFRGQGHGRHLMEVTLDKAVELGHQQVTLYVYSWNEPALCLYESLGFVDETPERDECCELAGQPTTRLMVLDLSNRTTNQASTLLVPVLGGTA